MKTGAQLITEERNRQVEVEGFSRQHDLQHELHEFIYAAICYAESAKVDAIDKTLPVSIGEAAIKIRKAQLVRDFPWGSSFWKPTTCIRDLVKAGSLIAAAIDRLQMDENIE